jgi:hypothetical protein
VHDQAVSRAAEVSSGPHFNFPVIMKWAGRQSIQHLKIQTTVEERAAEQISVWQAN